jgi:ribonucleoside-diphosphate reductase alpha chain
VFRELAVSYLSRFDLAHVDPNESGFDALGKGVEEGKSPEDGPGQQATKYLSRGLTRSRTDNLVVMRGGSSAGVPSPLEGQGGGSKVTSLSSHGAGRVSDTIEGAVALKQETSHDLSPTEKLQALQWSKAGAAHTATKAERRAEAKAKGYEGEMCSECGNFTLVRNGTCMKCDTCGSTTGCS